MKYDYIGNYVKEFPKFSKWIRECPMCHAKGYDPKMPDDIGGPTNHGFSARYIKHYSSPLEVDEMGFCNVCSKHVNK